MGWGEGDMGVVTCYSSMGGVGYGSGHALFLYVLYEHHDLSYVNQMLWIAI